MTESHDFWPYILLMPSNHQERIMFIKDVLASKIAPSVLPCFEKTGTVLQKDLIQTLSHSNKSIIQYLDALRKYRLIRTNSRVEKGKRVVYHELTEPGWSFVRFFSKGLPSDISSLTESLLEDYLTNLISFYRKHNLEESIFFEVIPRVRTKLMMEGSVRYDAPDFVILGSSAIFTWIQCKQPLAATSEVTCAIPSRFPGGSSIELASHLASSNSKVVFVSSVGDDLNGWSILSHLVAQDVDVTHFVIEPAKRTNETFIIEEGTNRHSLVGIDEGFSLSIDSPSQIPWDVVKNSGIVYIGEVFVEVALSLATYCKANNVPLVFRCSPHYWELGIPSIGPILKQADVLLISAQEWDTAKLQLGVNPMSALRKHSNAEALITLDKTKFGLMTG